MYNSLSFISLSTLTEGGRTRTKAQSQFYVNSIIKFHKEFQLTLRKNTKTTTIIIANVHGYTIGKKKYFLRMSENYKKEGSTWSLKTINLIPCPVDRDDIVPLSWGNQNNEHHLFFLHNYYHQLLFLERFYIFVSKQRSLILH